MSKLKEARIKNKLTHQTMADTLKISKAFYWQIENNKRRLSYDMAIKIADIFKMMPDELFYEEYKKESQ